MIDTVLEPIGKIIEKSKKKIYGKTFNCPVCHLELSYHDVNEDGLVVCPLCGIVIELADVFGHSVPVVHDVEIKRHQPKLRLHPLSTHIPIGLFPFALLGVLFLGFISILQWYLSNNGFTLKEEFFRYLPLVRDTTTIFLILSILFSPLTFLTGYIDWYYRYEKRPYRMIELKIIFSIIFFILGIFAILLQMSNLIFDINGILIMRPINIIAFIFYLGVLIIEMIVIATLGHIGGLLVFGK